MLNIAVIINTVAVLVGSTIGYFTGKKLPDRFRQVLFLAIGALTIGLGIKLFLDYNNALVVLGSLALGVVTGELLDIEKQIGRIAGRKNSEDFVKGFITATVLFLAGPMTIIGSIKAGLEGNNEVIFIKSLMDGISSVMLAASFGAGVFLSAGSVYLVQGSLVTLAAYLSFLGGEAYIGDFSAVGGLILLMLGIRLMTIKEIRVGNFLPALVFSPVFTYLAGLISGNV